MADANDNLPTSRRGFFREAMKGLLKPVVAALEARLGMQQQGQPAGTPLRPPGAGESIIFGQLCDKCGLCAAACPAQAIELSPLPQIVPSRRPCTMCQGAKCIAACPTGALQSTSQIRIGVAVWCPTRCRLAPKAAPAGSPALPLPSPLPEENRKGQGQAHQCDICRQACPVEGALTIRENAVIVDGAKCTGCGMCEYLCPERPRAIHTDPL